MKQYRAVLAFAIAFSFIFSTPLMLSAKEENPADLSPTVERSKSFILWVQEDLKPYLVDQGINQRVVDKAFRETNKPITRIIELDRNQPEFTLTLQQYLSRTVSDVRVKKARQRVAENRELLNEIADKYKVQPRFIVALWGIETDFGRVSGGYNVVSALSTLIWDGRREKYFKKELVNALKIQQEGHIGPTEMKGSWAGAMGQCQFMPSSFNRFAVDYNGDGHKDIWGTKEDVFASIANYLSRSGWKVDETWGREVKLPARFNKKFAENDVKKPISEWQKLGVRKENGKNLPSRDLDARIVTTEGGSAYMVYSNFDTTLKWNKSDFFAIAVGTLADRIGTRYNKSNKNEQLSMTFQ